MTSSGSEGGGYRWDKLAMFMTSDWVEYLCVEKWLF